ncbi:MAG: Ohr family peroxiredoxin [Bacillota bacterium]|nr:MAG: Ohr family peroxiredoxin [Bacillota bacterium]
MQKLLERKATTHGGRNGKISQTLSGLTLELAKPVEMGGVVNQKTNPEELFSIGYSSCFASSIEYLLQVSKTPYEDIKVTVTTALVTDGDQGFKFDIQVEASIKGLSKTDEKNFIQQAFQFCPYSKAIKGNVNVVIK